MKSVTFTLTNNGNTISAPKSFPKETTIQKQLGKCNIATKKKGTLLTSTNTENCVKKSLGHNLVGAIFKAYSGHHKLLLRPDDLWLSIVITLANYVDNHSEEMRKLFVEHDGKDKLIVRSRDGNIHNAIKTFSDLIDSRTIGSVKNWIEPTFSTTTENDSLIARVALMGAMKNYFSYKWCIECGIPEVTLMGTLEDWQLLRQKVDHISEYTKDQPALASWREILLPIIDKFIDSYQGNADENFWQSCANYISGGSGPSYVSGWVLAFAPFDDKGSWRLNSLDLIKETGNYGKVDTSKIDESDTVEVPLVVDDNGNTYEAYFYAGGIVNTYDKANNTIAPRFDFAMFKVPNGTLDSTDKAGSREFTRYC